MGSHDLYEAVKEGNEDKLQKLLDKPGVVKINKLYDGHETLLTMAVRVGNDRTVELLIDRGADINVKNHSGKAALHLACYEGNVKITRLLLARGADMNQEDDAGKLALHWAVRRNHVKVIQELLQAENTFNLDKKIEGGDTALHEAIVNCKEELVFSLIEGGASVNVLNDEGNAPIHVAATYGRLAIVQALVDKGAEVCIYNNNGESILHMSCKLGHYKMTEYILDLLKDNQDFINKQTIGGKSLINGKNIDSCGWSALHIAAAQGTPQVVQLLLDCKANTELKTMADLTAQKIAILYKHRGVLKVFGIDEVPENNTSKSRRASMPVVSNKTSNSRLRRASAAAPAPSTQWKSSTKR